MSHIGKQIAAVRKERGISQYQLAKFSGTDPTYMRKIESGDAKAVSFAKVQELAEFLGVSLDELVSR